MPKRELLYEWMHRFEYTRVNSNCVIRVWTKGTFDWGSFVQQHKMIEDALAKLNTKPDPISDGADALIVSLVSSLFFISAIEILDASGNGRLVYVDWP